MHARMVNNVFFYIDSPWEGSRAKDHSACRASASWSYCVSILLIPWISYSFPHSVWRLHIKKTCIYDLCLLVLMVFNFGSQQATRYGITYCAKGECTIEWGIELSCKGGGRTEEDECSLDREECFPCSLEGTNASWKSGIFRQDTTCENTVNQNKLGLLIKFKVTSYIKFF